MREKAAYEKVDLLLVTHKMQNYGSLRQSLNSLEFRNIRTGADIEDIRHALKTRMPDLLITDSDLPDGDVCDLIREIRQNKVGSNPFMTIIVTTWSPSVELVHKVINSGADDLLVQPASRGQLSNRIKSLTFNRKPFVVTATYVGPDRRDQPRPGTQGVPLIDVPNVLKAKATGELDIESLQEAIDRIAAHVNQSKMERNSLHILHTVNEILPAFRDGRVDKRVQDELQGLLVTAQDMAHRVKGTEHEHISKLCEALISVIQRLIAFIGRPRSRDLRLLPELAKSIRLAFDGSEATANAAAMISDAIAESAKRAVGEG